MSEVTIKPLADRAVVRPLTDEEAGKVSASGIIIPESAKKEQAGEGIIIAIGDGKWDVTSGKKIPMEVKVGDRVVYSKYGFDELKLNDKSFYIVAESSILAVLN